MTPFERATKVYHVLSGRMITPSLEQRDIEAIKQTIQEAINETYKECADIAETHYQSMTELLHQDLSELEKSIGMNIARSIRQKSRSNK